MKSVTIFKRGGVGVFFDQTNDPLFPSKIYLTVNNNCPVFTGKHSCYIYIHQAGVESKIDFLQGLSFPLFSNSVIRTPIGKSFRLHGVGYAMIIEMLGINEIFQINPYIEKSGRLKYIDGCTDTLLLSPSKLGLPCLSALYFPKRTIQTQHTHPSYRVGMVISGSGICKTPEGVEKMEPGDMVIVHTNGTHAFETTEVEMSLISFHPDSEFGPQDTNHPMINRTIVNGVSASELGEIQTKN